MSPSSPAARGRSRFTPWLCALSLCALVACGGGSDAAPETRSADAASPPPSGSTPAATVARQQEGARLNTTELEQIARTGVLPPAFEGPSLSGAEAKAGPEGGAAKSAASRVPVYRFFNTRTSAHFFTTSETERANTQATLPFMSFEGPAFHASSTAVPGLSPVHRFYNTATGVHFYTISEAERAHVAATLPQFSYEGVAYHASTLPGTGYTPLYRFFYASKGFHFYSNSAAERDNIIATLRQYSYEGVGYYVLGSDWQTPAVPHTGITNAQCYLTGSSTLVACSSAGATALNPQQDGHRTAVNPMSYTQIPRVLALPYPVTSCVRDNVTGLVWEGKTAGNGDTVFSNTGLPSGGLDAADHVTSVNAAALCGFTDWRMPTTDELHSIVNYSATGSAPRINTTSFPNTRAGRYWTSEIFPLDQSNAWFVDFSHSNLRSSLDTRNTAHAVRLVRGSPWVGQRYLFTSLSYAGDAANNAVTDRRTGLTWRRCMEGKVWSGSTCTGTSTNHLPEGALGHANSRPGWRLPNIKELGTLSVLNQVAWPSIDQVAFPGTAIGDVTMASTPYLVDSRQVWCAYNGSGSVYACNGITQPTVIRLVRIQP